jgi:hypothetical protein
LSAVTIADSRLESVAASTAEDAWMAGGGSRAAIAVAARRSDARRRRAGAREGRAMG